MPLPAANLPVDVEPFRKRFEYLRRTGQIDSYELAERLGYYKNTRGRCYPDTTRALRDVGLLKKKSGKGGRHYVTQVIATSKALKLCEALHMDPVDADF